MEDKDILGSSFLASWHTIDFHGNDCFPGRSKEKKINFTICGDAEVEIENAPYRNAKINCNYILLCYRGWFENAQYRKAIGFTFTSYAAAKSDIKNEK